MLEFVESYHCMLFQGKLMNQTWENGKKPSCGLNFGPNLVPQNFFSLVLSLLDVRNCWKLSLYAISRKTNKPNLRKWEKNLVVGPILAQIWSPEIFFIGFVSTRCCWKLSLYAISRKTNEPNLRKWKKNLVSGLALAQI